MAVIKLKLQVLCDDAIAMGPGKADLLDTIAQVGSIAGAARAMGMSYRRAWQLVDVMNRCWTGPLVDTVPGRATGGAQLTPLGVTVLARFRALQAALDGTAGQAGWDDLAALLREHPLAPRSADPMP
jgi:molybdate transport system regulatory protein